MGKVIAIVNQKGGVGKTATCESLGIGLARQGERVLLVDTDPQASLTNCLYKGDIDDLPATITDVFMVQMEADDLPANDVILRDIEGIDLVPADITLSGIEVRLVNEMSRERLLGNFLAEIKDEYDYILIDCSPSLGMITINALAAADSVIIPVEPTYKSEKGMELLLQTIRNIQRKINPNLVIDGILLNKVSRRANSTKEIIARLREKYRVYDTEIPISVREQESGERGVSIYSYDARGKVAGAYEELTQEVLAAEQQRRQKEQEERQRQSGIRR